MKHKGCVEWRLARIAARIIRQRARGIPLSPRRAALAQSIYHNDAVSERLIDQALGCVERGA